MCCLLACVFVVFFKQKTAYEMRISDWSSDVCSSDLCQVVALLQAADVLRPRRDPVDAGAMVAVNDDRGVIELSGCLHLLEQPAELLLHALHLLEMGGMASAPDRKSTRLNSSH